MIDLHVLLNKMLVSHIVYLLILCCKLNPMTFNSYSQDVASFNIETFYKNETMLPEMG